MTQKVLYKQPAPDEILASALKLLAFEEPASRCARLKKLVSRQLSGDSESQRLFKQFDALAIACQFSEIYQDQSNRSRDMLINIVIGLSDIFSFTNQAFKIWQNAINWQEHQSDLLQGQVSAEIANLLEQMVTELNLTPAQSAWLHYLACAAPGWTGLFTQTFEDMPKISAMAAIFENRSLTSVADLVAATKALTGLLRPSALLLVEGQSECIILPKAMHVMGLDLDKVGVHIIASGGVQQVVRRFLFYREIVTLPLICLLDQDASDASEIIADSLRDIDGLLVLQSGELEDTFSDTAMLDILNGQLMRHGQSLPPESFVLPKNGKRKDALNRLFRSHGLGDFDKLEFAAVAAEKLEEQGDVPMEIKKLAGILTSRLNVL